MQTAYVISARIIPRPGHGQIIIHASPRPGDPRQPGNHGQRPEERQPASNRSHRVKARRHSLLPGDHVHGVHAGLSGQCRMHGFHLDHRQIDGVQNTIGIGGGHQRHRRPTARASSIKQNPQCRLARGR